MKTEDLSKARKILGISYSTKEEEVKRIYRDLARRWHPDINPSREAQRKMQEINHAFEVIMKEAFGKLDPWKDYQSWWFRQYGNDPIWGNLSEDRDNVNNRVITTKHKRE